MGEMSKSRNWRIEDRKNVWEESVVRLRERWRQHAEGDDPSERDMREMKLYHGLKLISSATLAGHSLDICYRRDTQEYLVLDNALTLTRFSIQAKPIQPSFLLYSTMTFTKMIWCEKIDILAGFSPHDDLVWILDSTLKLNQVIRNEFGVENLFYTSHSNEIVVVGCTKVTRFPMERVEQTLNPWKTINMSDPSFGPTWKLDFSSLIESDWQYLKLAGSYSTTLYIIPLTCEKDEDSNVPVKFIAKKTNATDGVITALYFHFMSQWTICGDQRGNISAWNLHLECMMNYPYGHTAGIRTIIGHPTICGFISSGQDNILQVWSCNFREKIESFSDLGEVSHMALNKSTSSLAMLGTKLTCLQMHQLYNFYSALSSEAVQLFRTIDSTSISHVISYSSDGSIRMLASQSGEQTNVYGTCHDCQLPTAIAHSSFTSNIYVVENDGTTVSVIDASIQPMKLVDTWNLEGKSLTCLIVYDHYNHKNRTPSEFVSINPVCVRILIGTTAGELMSINEESGQAESTISAHNGSVIKLNCSMMSARVISLGSDNSLRIWRILPDILMPLALLDCVYYDNIIIDIAPLMLTVCIVNSSEHSTVHQLLMYNTTEKKHSQHHCSKDHTKLILAIDSLEHIGICVTSSKDATIRIWNDENALLRILEMNICVTQLTFSSLSGDIVFGAGKHLYIIPHGNYLSSNYDRGIIENTSGKWEDRDSKENEIFLQPISSVPLGSLDPNAEGPHIDSILKEQSCMQLKYRDEDISRIKRNYVQAAKLVKTRALLKYDDWKRHLNELSTSCGRIYDEINSSYDVLSCRKKYIDSQKIDMMSKNITKEPRIDRKSLMKISHPYRDNNFIPNSIFIDGINGNNGDCEVKQTMAMNYSRELDGKKALVKYIYPTILE